MFRPSTILIAVFICIAAGVYIWSRNELASVEERDHHTPDAKSMNRDSNKRGAWAVEYEAEVAEVTQFLNAALQHPTTTPEKAEKVRETLASSIETLKSIATREQLREIMIAFMNHNDIFRRLVAPTKVFNHSSSIRQAVSM